jgi:hypothetical protein
MPKGIANHLVYHRCKDGQLRRIQPVYFRLEDRKFHREAWYCNVCKYGQWQPLKENGDIVASTSS